MDRSIMGYNINIIQQGDQFKVEVPTLNKEFKCQSLGTALIQIYKQTVDHINMLELKGSLIPKPDNIENFHGKLQYDMFMVNRKISSYGYCIISEFMKNEEFRQIEQMLNDLDDDSENESKIGQMLSGNIMLPANRALMMTAVIMKTKHVSDFSHLIERAYMQLMLCDFISVTMILTPVIEGIFSKFIGHDPTSIKPVQKKKVYRKLAELQYPDTPLMKHPYLFDEYIRCFIDICDDVFFNTTDKAEESDYFNRNYITHLAGSERFYSRNNALKIVLLLDLITFIISYADGKDYLFNKNKDDKDFQKRWNYYVYLVEKSIMPIKKVEYDLFMEHKNFKGYL